MALKNATSKSANTFDRIQKCLASHGAKKLMFDYNDDGKIDALSFAMDVDGKTIGFKLPARIENVSRVMYGHLLSELGAGNRGDERRDQVYRTAWANIRDWVEAQMALIDTRMAKVEEVFLPYMTAKNGKTLFESIEEGKFKMLE